MTCPSVAVAGLSGDCGKTLVALGLAAAWTRAGKRVVPFKKGPDYIDAAWLTLAAERSCRNLDTFLMTENVICRTWKEQSAEADVALIEGNRGLFDGMDVHGSHSTASLAKLVGAPLITVVDVTKMTRTAAALVAGIRALDPELELLGVVLNRVAGERHEKIAREAVEMYTGVPVFGAIRKLKDPAVIPGRHLGLLTTDEHPAARQAIDNARIAVEDSLDLERIEKLMKETPHRGRCGEEGDPGGEKVTQVRGRVKIGVVRDAAFPFYYPENLEALTVRGAEIIEVSALGDEKLPADLDGLYCGGGFPETHARRLSENRDFLRALKAAAESGLPIYAECGGLILLARSLEYEGRKYPMAGVFPVDIGWSKRPAGHGYTIGRIDTRNPFYPVGGEIRGHEFHYSHLGKTDFELHGSTVVGLTRGNGVGGGRDGLLKANTLAMYTHVHASGMDAWADGLVRGNA